MSDRRQFLKTTGLVGITSLFPFSKINSASGESGGDRTCVLIPTETAGPFPLDLTTNSTFFRQDIRETKTGVQLNVKMKIIGADNCEPMPNVRVNIWHCDKDGSYSGYSTSQGNTSNTVGETWLRGYQMTDANGEIEFISIFPGWYTGRICHIHFQVYVSSSYAAVSQMTFDINTKNAIYQANASLYTKGADPMTFASDNIFSDGYAYQLATLTPNTNTGGYDAYLEVTVQGAGTLGLGYLEKETAKQFVLEQNFPNPYTTQTTIPFTLKQTSDVVLQLWDLSGKKVFELSQPGMSAGDQELVLNMADINLSTGNYIYQLEVSNENGLFKQNKMMTAKK